MKICTDGGINRNKSGGIRASVKKATSERATSQYHLGCKAEFASKGAQSGNGDARARKDEVDIGNELGRALFIDGGGQVRKIECKSDELDNLGCTSALRAFFRETKYKQ
jgi:hypothetical protein